MIRMKYMYFLGLLALFSCEKKEKTIYVEVAPEYRWEKENYFSFEKSYITNSHASDDALYYIGYKYFSVIPASDNSYPDYGIDQQKVSYEHDASLSINSIPEIGDDYFIKYSISENYFDFIPVRSPKREEGRLRIRIEDYDPSFTNLNLFTPFNLHYAEINELGQALIQYFVDQQARYLLVDLDIENDPYNNISLALKNVQLIQVEDILKINNPRMFHEGNQFFIGSATNSYKISPLGNIQQIISGNIRDMFRLDQNLFAFVSLAQIAMYQSTDQGNTWHNISNAPLNDDIIRADYVEINDAIFAYYNHQLFELQPEGEGFRFIELDNDGLEHTRINSLNYLEGKIYVSATTGVFSKSWDDFRMLKVEEEDENE